MASALTKFASSTAAETLAALIKELDEAKARLEPLIKTAREQFEDANIGNYGIHETALGSLVYSSVMRTAWASLVPMAKKPGTDSGYQGNCGRNACGKG